MAQPRPLRGLEELKMNHSYWIIDQGFKRFVGFTDAQGPVSIWDIVAFAVIPPKQKSLYRPAFKGLHAAASPSGIEDVWLFSRLHAEKHIAMLDAREAYMEADLVRSMLRQFPLDEPTE